MSATSKNSNAVILIDPVSSGRFLKLPVLESGHCLIAVFTLSPEELESAGKGLPLEEKHAYCDVVIYAKTAAEVIAQLQAHPFEIRAVIPASEPGVELADQLSHHWGLKGHAPSTSLLRRDKYYMRRAVRAAGLGSPDFAACYERKDAVQFARSHTFPMVVKTPKGAGAHHVFICKHEDEVLDAFEAVIHEKNIFGNPTGYALIEEFIVGDQYVVELFGDGENLHLFGLWKFEFQKNAQNKIVFDRATLITDPAELAQHQDLVTYAQSVGRALGIQWGPSLVELRRHPERGPLLIEAGSRLSGIDLPVLVKASSNFNPFSETIKVYLTRVPYDFEPVTYQRHASLVFCPVQGSGKIHAIEGIEAIQMLPSYVQGHLHAHPGDVIGSTQDLATIPFYAYLAHPDREQFERDAAATREAFRISFVTPATPEEGITA